MSASAGHPMTVRIPDDMRQRVAAMATATRRSQGDVVREALERSLDELEWEQRIVERAAEYRSGRQQPVGAAEVDALLGLTGQPPAADALDSIE